jgi:hypothetical protein
MSDADHCRRYVRSEKDDENRDSESSEAPDDRSDVLTTHGRWRLSQSSLFVFNSGARAVRCLSTISSQLLHELVETKKVRVKAKASFRLLHRVWSASRSVGKIRRNTGLVAEPRCSPCITSALEARFDPR